MCNDCTLTRLISLQLSNAHLGDIETNSTHSKEMAKKGIKYVFTRQSLNIDNTVRSDHVQFTFILLNAFNFHMFFVISFIQLN